MFSWKGRGREALSLTVAKQELLEVWGELSPTSFSLCSSACARSYHGQTLLPFLPGPFCRWRGEEALLLLPANRLGLRGWGQPQISWHRGPLLQAGCPNLEALFLSKCFCLGEQGALSFSVPSWRRQEIFAFPSRGHWWLVAACAQPWEPEPSRTLCTWGFTPC